VATAARDLGLELWQPESVNTPEAGERVATSGAAVVIVCAFGALIKEPLLADFEILNLHPSLLPRWRGAAPVERAIMAGDEQTGVAIMRLTAGLDSGPICLMEEEPIHADDDYGSLAARLERRGGDLLVRAMDERPPFTEQPDEGVTYAEKITGKDRTLDATRPPEYAERTVRALRPHIGARIPLPDGSHLGVWSARVAGETLAPAGGRLRREGDTLFLDCNGGALELLEVQPPGGRRMPTAEWLRGRPDPRLTDFWLDPALPEQDLDTIVDCAIQEWDRSQEWAPHLAALCWRGSAEVLDAMREMARSPEITQRCVAAYVLGQLGVPARTFEDESDRTLQEMAAVESEPRVLATIAHAFDNLGDGHGLDVLLSLLRHPDAAVRDGVARALSGRRDERATEALMELSTDPDPQIRDWATFALGALAEGDTPELRDALAARLSDEDDAARVEAVHGLALRGDLRALEPALELLEAGRHRTEGPWHGHALEEASIRLAALSGDARFGPHLPPVDRYADTTLEHDLRLAHERLAATETA
jgi:methionyl-tRNA formyltransferase